jgi:hypothetical protein
MKSVKINGRYSGESKYKLICYVYNIVRTFINATMYSHAAQQLN